MWKIELFLSQKSQFDLAENIKIKIARAHHFLNLQRTGNKNFFMWPYINRYQNQIRGFYQNRRPCESTLTQLRPLRESNKSNLEKYR